MSASILDLLKALYAATLDAANSAATLDLLNALSASRLER